MFRTKRLCLCRRSIVFVLLFGAVSLVILTNRNYTLTVDLHHVDSNLIQVRGISSFRLPTTALSVHHQSDRLRMWKTRLVKAGLSEVNGYHQEVFEDLQDISSGPLSVVMALTGSKTNGYYIDVRSEEGVINTVTLDLERQLQWTGLVVESEQTRFQSLLSKHLRADCLHAKLWLNQSVDIPPSENHLSPKELLQLTNHSTIDLLSLNIHEQEIDFLSYIDFDLYPVKLIVLNMRSDGKKKDALDKVIELMGEYGYRLAHHTVEDEINKKDVVFVREQNEGENFSNGGLHIFMGSG